MTRWLNDPERNIYQTKQVLCNSYKVQINPKYLEFAVTCNRDNSEGILLISYCCQDCHNWPRSPQSLSPNCEEVYYSEARSFVKGGDNLYCCSHAAIVTAQIFVDGINPQESYFQKSTNISAIVRYMSVSFVSLQRLRAHLQNNTFILRKIVENLCDMAYQKHCKIVVSKEVCLHYMTQPL